ncbi:hypothetical protein, partial [Parabacteroides sp.]
FRGLGRYRHDRSGHFRGVGRYITYHPGLFGAKLGFRYNSSNGKESIPYAYTRVQTNLYTKGDPRWIAPIY